MIAFSRNEWLSVGVVYSFSGVQADLFVSYRERVFGVRESVLRMHSLVCREGAWLRLLEGSFHRGYMPRYGKPTNVPFDFTGDVLLAKNTTWEECAFDLNANFWGLYDSSTIENLYSEHSMFGVGKRRISILLRDSCPSRLPHMPVCQYSYMLRDALNQFRRNMRDSSALTYKEVDFGSLFFCCVSLDLIALVTVALVLFLGNVPLYKDT